MNRKKLIATVLVVLVCVGAVRALRLLRPDPEELLRARMAERALGDPKSSLWITEYFDYQCPPCATARGVLETVMTDHPDKIFLQARYFPLPAHKNALKAAVYAECASRQKGKFWKFHEEVLKHQAEWAMDAYPELKFGTYAEAAGLDTHKLNVCVQDEAVKTAVLDEKKKAEGLGVKITPTFFLNEKMIVGINALKDEVNAFFGAASAVPAPASEASHDPSAQEHAH